MRTQLAKRTERMPSLFADLFSRSWNDWINGDLPTSLTSTPSVNIAEHEDDYLVSMAAPGLKKEDFKVNVDGHMLSISSEKEESSEEKEEKYARKEYSYSSFERCFTLPDEIDKDNINASYKDGVLEIVLPKKEEAKKLATSKAIKVK